MNVDSRKKATVASMASGAPKMSPTNFEYSAQFMPNWNSSVMPGDHPDGEVHQRGACSSTSPFQEGLVPRPRVAGLHVGDHDGEPEGERDEEEVEEGDGGELDPGEYCDAHGRPFHDA